ncbi:peptidase, M16 family [Candidatus Magnetoovum chiemensis]|nr:peptidase, M16 family [Candidatus Magnetoovum chiemensis]
MKNFLIYILLISIITLFLNSCLPVITKQTEEPVKETPPEKESPVVEHTLENGLKMFIAEDHKSPIATFQIWYKAGSIVEPKGKSGITHFLEHMMFKGTKKYASKEFSRIIQKNGGVDNAYTTNDYAMYYQTLASDRINLSIEMEADRMVNLLLNPKEVEAEKKVIMEERRLRYEDDPQNLLFEKVTAAAMANSPYKNPVIGWMDEIKSITREDLVTFNKKYYVPNNAFIVISGDVNHEEIIREIEDKFGKIPSNPINEQIVIPELVINKGQERLVLEKQAKLPYLIQAYNVPSIPDKDSYCLEVLVSILTGNSGRLYENIVKDKKIALDTFSFYSGLYKAPYLLYLGGTVNNSWHSIEELEDAIYQEIDKIKETPPLEKEVQKAKNQIEAAFIMGQDSIFFEAEVVGMFEILGDWRLKQTYLDEINNVTPIDVQNAAKKYLNKENSTVGILIPKE